MSKGSTGSKKQFPILSREMQITLKYQFFEIHYQGIVNSISRFLIFSRVKRKHDTLFCDSPGARIE